MSVYVVKISNDENIKKVQKLQTLTHDGINLFENEISLNDPVFIYFGGDQAQVSWKTGLAAVGKIVKGPYDNGYLKNNFKIDIQPLHVLKSPIPPIESKLHIKLSRHLWGAPYFGANHFPTQAIQRMKNNDATLASGELYSEYAPNSIEILESLGVYDKAKLSIISGAQIRQVVTPEKVLNNGIVEAFILDATNAKLKISTETIKRLIASLISKRFLILTGLSGSGKTKLAHAFATWISLKSNTPDPFSPGSLIESDRITYFVNKSDALAVEFWNKETREDATIVTLPREMIREWAKYIEDNSITRDIGARQLREAVSQSSKFSPQLHSFETHLKAAAFALLDSLNNISTTTCYKIVTVGADWTSNENILGYQDALQPTIYRKPSSGALDLILRADKDPDNPYFLILDEMNLSHVERYFADVLSAIESNQPISLHSAKESLISYKEDPLPVPPSIKLPDNLFIIGTVNVDETTYMFSPKVLDRANVIEFRPTVNDISEFLSSPSRVNMEFLSGLGVSHGNAFVKASISDVSLESQLLDKTDGDKEKSIEIQKFLNNQLIDLFRALEPIGAEFGFRTAMEVIRFISFHCMLSAHHDWIINDALDAQIVQKVMPKLHGSDRKLRPILEKLQVFCKEHRLILSYEKSNRMLDRLKDGFTSFAEA